MIRRRLLPVQLALDAKTEAKRRLTETEARMTGVLDELRPTDLVTSIVGLSAVGAGCDPGRNRRLR
ncbi:hypothetical protein GCM10027088_10160 [Nocardia goodfellowii]